MTIEEIDRLFDDGAVKPRAKLVEALQAHGDTNTSDLSYRELQKRFIEVREIRLCAAGARSMARLGPIFGAFVNGWKR